MPHISPQLPSSRTQIALNLLLHVDDDRTGTQLATNVKQLLGLLEATITPNPKAGSQRRPPTMTLHWGTFVTEALGDPASN